MPDSALNLTRPWMEIAEEVSREQDFAKLSKLVRELNQALEEQGVNVHPFPQEPVR
jgi:predicted secreted protein